MKIFSVINLSKESPQKDAWAATAEDAIKKVNLLQQLGSDYIDIGARSSFSKSVEIDERLEQDRLASFFDLLPHQKYSSISLDTWSDETAIRYIPKIGVLNYTSTYFSDELTSKLANTNCPLVLNYLPAENPYALRKISYSPPSIKAIIDYFNVTVTHLEKKGVKILAIDPNLGMWHPETPDELKPVIQHKIIEAIPELKKIAPVFIIAPRTQGLPNIELIKLILALKVDFIRTHDIVTLSNILSDTY